MQWERMPIFGTRWGVVDRPTHVHPSRGSSGGLPTTPRRDRRRRCSRRRARAFGREPPHGLGAAPAGRARPVGHTARRRAVTDLFFPRVLLVVLRGGPRSDSTPCPRRHTRGRHSDSASPFVPLRHHERTVALLSRLARDSPGLPRGVPSRFLFFGRASTRCSPLVCPHPRPWLARAGFTTRTPPWANAHAFRLPPRASHPCRRPTRTRTCRRSSTPMGRCTLSCRATRTCASRMGCCTSAGSPLRPRGRPRRLSPPPQRPPSTVRPRSKRSKGRSRRRSRST